MKDVELICFSEPWHRGTVFLLRGWTQEQRPAPVYAKAIEWVEQTTYDTQPPPTFRMECERVQELMDNLWAQGYRPSEGTGSAGALKAVQYHLEDMRKLTFQLLEKRK